MPTEFTLVWMILGRVKFLPMILLVLLGRGQAQTISAVLNGASYSTNLAPGTWAAIFGSGLAASAAVAQSVPLPFQLGDVSITVGGIDAPLLYVSPGQINVLIPFELPEITGTNSVTVPLILTTAAGSVTQQITLQRNAPAIFTLNQAGSGDAIVLKSVNGTFELVDAVGTDPIVLYATGLGPVATPVSSAAGASAADSVKDFSSVIIGARDATLQYAGLAPDFPGIYQINIIPNAPLNNSLMLSANGYQSKAVTVPMNLGSNISNATGSIVPLYPTNTSVPVNITQLLLAATFSVDLQIKPGASAFDITAVSALPTGVATIHVDPPHGVWQATLAVPSAQARQYNFSGATDPVYDLNTCQQSATGVQCMAFPGNIVPASRIDPIAESAFSAMPLPTSTGNPNGAYTTSGSIPADGHLVIGSSQLNQLSTFGSFQELGATGVSGVDTLEFQLFADGLLLDSETVTAQVQ